MNTYAYVGGNPLIYSDPTGQNPYAALRGAFWTGGRIGAGINYGIQAVTGLSLGVLLYETFNDDGIDFGDAANDDDFEGCPTDGDDQCKKKFLALKGLFLGIQEAERSNSYDRHTIFKAKQHYMKEREEFIAECGSKGWGSPPEIPLFGAMGR